MWYSDLIMDLTAARNKSCIKQPGKSKPFQVKICWILLTFTASVTLPDSACCGTCPDPAYTMALRRGYYCDENITFTLQGMVRDHCKLLCLGKGSCVGLSYNLANMTCVINSQACLIASAHPNYEIVVFRPIHQHRCIRWVDSEPARRITAGYQNVGRATYDNQLLPGKYQINGDTFVAWESGEHMLRQAEYLEVDEYCSVAWVSYTAGDPIMSGAVQGSSLPDGTPLYVINLLIDETRGVDGWAYGYYRPDTELGYAGYNGHRTKTEMEMMIVI